ncbi:hypothetical protein SELMODRAFT_416612 [Selaginella moellendorffii]|uniref:Ubiquitin-like protease family profile domain-containing protein n=1 Tax=Selaginella moellendorffii TaxID=88036 RepID=D8RZV3_SELML|nr:hypothetical protein SELMODRAFT_416612 [Selaginella moellendorffii]
MAISVVFCFVLCFFLVQVSVGLLVQYGSTTVGNGNFVSLSSTDSAPTVDIEGFGKNGTTRLFSVVMADQKALVASNKVYPYINFWVANIPAGSTGAVKGSILEPYVSPSNTSKNIPYPNPFNARNHTYDFVLVPQRNPLEEQGHWALVSIKHNIHFTLRMLLKHHAKEEPYKIPSLWVGGRIPPVASLPRVAWEQLWRTAACSLPTQQHSHSLNVQIWELLEQYVSLVAHGYPAGATCTSR